MLAVTTTSLPASGIGWRTAASIADRRTLLRSTLSRPASRITNSSEPMRATVSLSRTRRDRRRAVSTRKASPQALPSPVFMKEKLSRSR